MSTYHFTIKPLEYDVFVGMDVDKRSISLTALTHQDELFQWKLPYDSQNVLTLVRKRFPGKRIVFVYEAGPTGYGLYDDITEAGYVCLVVPAAGTPQAASDRVKTNRVDSRKLAQSLRGGQLHGIHVPSVAYRNLRHLVQLREITLRQVVGAKNRIKGLLLLEGINFPPATRRYQWSLRVIEELKTLKVSAPLGLKLNHLVRQLEFSKKELKEITEQAQEFCTTDPEIHSSMELLMGLPGIAWIVAMHLLARIGDWRFLDNSRQIGALLGLIPCENSTGETVNRGSITRLGDSVARNKLIETAWTAVRTDPEFREFYVRMLSLHPGKYGKRQSIVAVARKLTTRIYAVLKYRRPYLSKSEYTALQGKTRRLAERTTQQS
jgi:transposase